MSARRLSLAGFTVSGAPVVEGAFVFELANTLGLPLEFSLAKIFEKNMVVDWLGYVIAARKSGWIDRRIFVTVTTALVDAEVPA